MTEKEPDGVTGHFSMTEVREGILDYQVQNCPTCSTELEDGFGMAGGGMGVYGYCPRCERVIWKCPVDM